MLGEKAIASAVESDLQDPTVDGAAVALLILPRWYVNIAHALHHHPSAVQAHETGGPIEHNQVRIGQGLVRHWGGERVEGNATISHRPGPTGASAAVPKPSIAASS